MGRKRMKKVGPTRGFGARYGSRVRKRYIEIITKMRKKHKCPQCTTQSVRRKSTGLWNCKKCGITFTGGAYTPETKLGATAKRIEKRASA
jgi:large subunit ribosomal protein L37Ae